MAVLVDIGTTPVFTPAARFDREFLGVRFTPHGLDHAAHLIAQRARATGRFAYVTTPNVDHVVGLNRDPRRESLYEEAWLRLNDSAILSRLARWSGFELQRATGADLTALLLKDHIRAEEPVCVIGADAATIAALKRRYRLRDLRWHRPPMGLARNPAAIAEAAAFAARSRAPFTFLCVGAPQQEMVAQAIARRGDAAGVGLCVGSSLHFAAGTVERAPEWARRLGLEWAHRLSQDPGRLWRRYLWDGPAILTIWARWMKAQAGGAAPARASISARSAR